jgi:hypothetical protein
MRIHATEWFSREVLPKTRLRRRGDKRASDDEKYPRRDVVLRSDHRSQRERQEQPGHGRRGGRKKRRAYGYGDADGDCSDIHCRGDCRRRNT